MLDRCNPFPGLRCFLSEEDYLFFGRHAQIDDLLRRLRTNRMIAVVGTSGSGKSSLVRAGLLPAVLGGGMSQAGSDWNIAVLRPGGSPLAHLARALCAAGLYDADAEDVLFHLQATLSRSRNGLLEAVRQSRVPAGSKLLLVVDQFEELFRFHRASATSQEEAIDFVNLLLHATQQAEQRVYVVLTMRSDYLGECSQFLGLAEAVNNGEFLIPRMTRDQIQEAIEGPLRVRGTAIAPRLLFRLLNDVQDNQDQLPVLQHALMRTWDECWRSQGDGVVALDLEHYEATGGMHEALSRHANEIYEAFPSDIHRTTAVRIFKALTERGSDGRGIRRPTRLGHLAAIAAVDKTIIYQVIEAYRAPGVTFLMPPVPFSLDDHSVIDISHESLMRVWNRLRGWVEEEAQSARIYRRLHETAGLHAEKHAGLFHDPDLQIALTWREANQPNLAWASQYGGGFDEAMAFLDASQEAADRAEKEREAARQRELEQAQQLAESQRLRLKQQQRATKRLRKLIAGLAIVTLIAGLACIAALVARQEATRLAALAEQEADKARQHAKRAEQSQQEADQARLAAQAETYHAVLSEVRALRAGREPGWREKALGDLARLAVMPTPRRDLPELRSEAAATLGTPDVRLVARVALPDAPGSFTFSPDGSTLVTAGPKLGADFWDVVGKRHLSSVEGLKVGEGIDNIVYLPDGQGLAVGTLDRGVVFTDMKGNRRNRAPITQGSSQPTRLRISAKGERIAVAWTGGAGITVHDTASGALLGKFKDSNPIFALSPDGKWLARQENVDIVLLSIPSGEPRIVLGSPGRAHALAFSPKGDRLAAALADHTTVLWDVAKREHLGTLRGHRERVFDVAFSPDGEWIATGSLDYTTKIWDTRTGQNVATLPGFTSPTFGVKWSPTGDFLAVSLNNSREVLLYQITGRHRVQQWLIGHRVELGSVAAHPRLERLATSGYTELSTWDLSVSRPSPIAIGPNPGAVTALAYSPDGSLLAISSGQVLIRDANTGKVQGRISGPSPRVDALAFDPTGGQLACGDAAGNVILWDLATNRSVHKFATGSRVWSIIFLDRPRRLVTHGRNAVLLFNLESGKLEKKIELASGGIRTLVADRERSCLVVGFENGAICRLSLPDLTPGLRLEKAHDSSVACLALSPDGRLLASASDHRVVLRDARSFETLLRFPLWDGTLRNLTFDSKGRRLAFVGTGNDVDLWDLDALRDGLAEVGLAWDRPAPNVVPATGLTPEDEHLRPAVPVLRRPATIAPTNR